jgi:2-oxoglutarate ferredoxin oxidoreductase subunit beta
VRDAQRHDPADEVAAFHLATLPWPGVFGVFYETNRPTKNRLEADLIARSREKTAGKSELQILQSTFARMR